MVKKKKKFTFTKPQLEWLAALESGKFKRAEGDLCAIRSKARNYCCLGVACQINIENLDLITEFSDGRVKFDGEAGALPVKVAVHLDMLSDDGSFKDGNVTVGEDLEATSLVDLNDDLNWSHRKIAKWIRKNPEQVFKS